MMVCRDAGLEELLYNVTAKTFIHTISAAEVEVGVSPSAS